MPKHRTIIILMLSIPLMGMTQNNKLDATQIVGYPDALRDIGCMLDTAAVHRAELDALNGAVAGDNDGDPTNELQSLAILTTEADRSSIASAAVGGDANEPDNILTLTPVRVDMGIGISGNAVTNNIGGDHVVIDALAYSGQPSNPAYARISPELELLKNGVVVAKSGSGYQRHASGHDGSSNGIGYTDPDPSVGDTYSLRAQQGSGQDDVLGVDIGHLTVRVVERITVLRNVTISD